MGSLMVFGYRRHRFGSSIAPSARPPRARGGGVGGTSRDEEGISGVEWGGGCSCDMPRGSCYRRAPNRRRSKRIHIDVAPNTNNANNANKDNNAYNVINEHNTGLVDVRKPSSTDQRAEIIAEAIHCKGNFRTSLLPHMICNTELHTDLKGHNEFNDQIMQIMHIMQIFPLSFLVTVSLSLPAFPSLSESDSVAEASRWFLARQAHLCYHRQQNK